MGKYLKLTPPATGTKIVAGPTGALKVPDDPIIPFIEGDGTGPDIWRAASRVLDAAVQKAYRGKKKIVWFEVYAGEKAQKVYGDTCPPNLLPDETVEAFREYIVSIKGPLTTPVGKGVRSLNVTLRQALDLYVCLRPVRYFGAPSPVKRPELVDMVVFRENTEDIYAGIEWAAGTPEVKKIIAFLDKEMGVGKKIRFPATSGIGIKPMSQEGTQRLMRAAVRYAIANKRKSITIVHKGNIMKFTEGAFREWGYALAKQEFPAQTVSWEECNGKVPPGKILVKDAIADAFLQQILTRANEFDVIVTPNLNGDYLSDALAAQVGGIGIAPGANINFNTGHAGCEATHGTAPKYAGQDKVNPGSVILSGELMFRHLGWAEAADLVVHGIERAIQQKVVTYDFARLMEGAKEVKCSEFGTAIIENMG